MSTVMIVGANRGIGLELCRQYQDKGYQVIAVCRSASDELKKLGVEVISDIDVTQTESLKKLSHQIGDQKIDVLIHNAGIMRSESLASLDPNVLLEQLTVNSVAPLITVSTLLPKLNKGAKVAVMSSRMGSVTDNDSGGAYGYRMSKSAVNAAFKSLSLDLKNQNIAVAVLHPGWVRTDMTSHNGLMDPPESVAGLIKVLDQLSLENTGQFWHTNGEVLPW